MTSNGAPASDPRAHHDPSDGPDSGPSTTPRHADLPFLEDALDYDTDTGTRADTAPGSTASSNPDGTGQTTHGPRSGAQSLAAEEPKPLWRGWLHAGTFPVATAAGIVLIAVAHGPIAKWAAAVYMLSSMLLFGVSALYHRFDWKPATRQVFRRLDHANIFLLISGTYTPIALLALPLDKGVVLLIAVWAGAFIGIGFRVFWLSAPRWLYIALYVALGWAAVMFLGDIARANLAAMVLVVVGGLLYTLGSVVYGFKGPNPVPGVFGFHEIFHALTVLAFLCHWTAALLLVLDPFYLR